MKVDETSKRIAQLDGLRFPFIILVILSHCYFLSQSSIVGKTFEIYADMGGFAVNYFFILSGFGLYYSKPKSESKITIKNSVSFAIRKISKVYPIYIFSLFVGLFSHIPQTLLDNNMSIVALLKTAIMDIPAIFLMQSLVSVYSLSHAINGVCWFLSTLFICYMFVLVFFRFLSQPRSVAFRLLEYSVAVFVVFVLSMIATKVDNTLSSYRLAFNYESPFIRCWFLLIGMIIADISCKLKVRYGSTIEVITLVLFVCFYFARPYLQLDSNILRIFDILSISLLILIFSKGRGVVTNLLSSKFLVFAGLQSVYLYLLHFPIVKMDQLFAQLIGRYIDINAYIGEYYLVVRFVFVIVFTLIVVKICKTYENKIRKAVMSVFKLNEEND